MKDDGKRISFAIRINAISITKFKKKPYQLSRMEEKKPKNKINQLIYTRPVSYIAKICEIFV